VRGAFGYTKRKLPLSDATAHVIDARIVCGHFNAHRINVRRRQK